MHEKSGKNRLSALRKKWMYKALLSQFLIVLALALFVFTLLNKLFLLPLYWSVPCLLILFVLITILNPSWKLSEWDVARYLNSTQPSLEESADLILKPQSSLNILEKLQVRKVESRLSYLIVLHPFKKQFVASLVALLISLTVAVVVFMIPLRPDNPNTVAKQTPVTNPAPEIKLPEIKNATIVITPPSYTGKTSRQQSSFNLLAEENAVVSWHIQSNIPAKEVTLIFSDGTTLRLSADVEKRGWTAQTSIQVSGFYQVNIDDKLSEFYKIEAIKDLPPTIAIQSPRPNTFINYGMPARVKLNAAIADDYGIASAYILATVSSGQGEAVKFKEQKLLFYNFARGHKNDLLQKLIDCKELGMAPGDELYFFINATDNHDQQVRSDVYVITLQDTAELMSMEGMTMNLDIKSEFFRSQRQIIIETEQLLKNKSIVSIAEFREKSSDLGIDQKMLRLRYGKFLGEESDAGTGEEANEEIDNKKSNTENANDILKKYGHEHDNAEDATFFDPVTKKQLKAMLTEMWQAELKLRTILPKEALPYEYKALQLLKDLQQKSRVYVQKTGIKVTPLKPGKRLTGDLSMISQPVIQQNLPKPDSASITVNRALGALEQLKNNRGLSISSKDILQQAFQQLGIQAAAQPAVYLTSLSSLRKILNENYTISDIDNAAQGFQKMAAATEKLPFTKPNAMMNLSRQYFLNLNKSSK